MTASAIQIVSTFVCDLIEQPLSRGVNEIGISGSIRVTPPAHLGAYMLAPSIQSEDVIGTVVLVRVEDWLRDLAESGREVADHALRPELRHHLDEFISHLSILVLRGRPTWLMVCPSTGWTANEYKVETLCRTMSNLLLARVRNLQQVVLLDWPATLSGAQYYNRQLDKDSHTPFTAEAFATLAESIGGQLKRSFDQNSGTAVAASPGSPELAAFLKELGVQVEVSRAKTSDRSDVDRILRTAASFSLTGENPTIPGSEVDSILASENCMIVKVSDRLSNYGPSGVVVARTANDSLVVDSMALSCTVLGKQVEYALLSALSEIARDRHLGQIVFEFRASGRNQPTLTFLGSAADAQTDQRYVLPVSEASERISHVAVAPGAWNVRTFE